MRVLALDTTTRAGSVALVSRDGGRVIVDEREGDGSRSHTQRLPAELAALLASHGLTFAAIDAYAVAAGPGSFTGLRIGIATIQGLALTTGRPVVAVSALEALAQIAGQTGADGGLIAPWMDAHRGEVFAALYRVEAARPVFDPARLVELDAPSVGDPAATLGRLTRLAEGRPMRLVGDGVLRHREAIERAGPVGGLDPSPPLAGAIGRMAVVRVERGEAAAPSAVRPLYVRRPDAELERERKRRA